MRIHSRLVLFVFVVTLVPLGGATLLWNRDMQEDRRLALDERLLDQARVLSVMLPPPAADNLPELDRLVRLSHRETQSRITVIALDGTVLAESDLPPAQVDRMENHQSRPEMQDALRRGVGRDQRSSPTLGVPMAYLAVRWGPSQSPYGVVRTALPMHQVVAEQNRGRDRLAAVLFGALTLAVGLGYVAARGVFRPILRVSRTAQAIAAGDLGRRAEIAGSVEARDLAVSVNHLAQSVSQKILDVEMERQRLSQLLEGMPDGILALGRDGRIEAANDAAREMLGLDADAVGLSPVEAVRHPELQRAVDRALSLGEEGTVEVTLLEPRRRELVVNLVSLERGLVMVIHDVTRLRRLEISRRDMVANVGHELRTPLASILGYVETLQDPDLSKNERERFLGIIQRNARRLERLVRDLSQLARLESPAAELDHRPVDANALIERAIETTLPRALKKNVTLTSDVAASLSPVNADPHELETVLLNLLDNALRSAPENTAVTVSAHAAGDAVRFAVRDEGIGIPPHARERVFERFYRVDAGRTSEAGGSGLGLAIVKHIVQLHGGEVGLEGEHGRGATLFFTIPMAVKSTPSIG